MKDCFTKAGRFIRNRKTVPYLSMELSLDHHKDRKVIQESLPSGAYFIGDIFYALKHKYVDIVYENIEERVLTLEEDGKEYTIVFDKVFGGNQRYTDCYEHEYEVESGYLGIVPMELCDFGCDDPLRGKGSEDDDIDQIGQKIEFDEMVDVYIVDGIFIFHWVQEKGEEEEEANGMVLGNHQGFLKIDTKNAEVPIVEDHEYNDISFEEYTFSQVNRTQDEDEEKQMDKIYTIQENVEDYDDVERTFEDNESKPIDPNLLELHYLDSFRSK